MSGTLPLRVRPTLRSTPWGQLATGGALALTLVLLTTGNEQMSTSEVVDRLRLAAVLLAIGVAGALDDATRPDLDGVPVPLAHRQGLRIGVAVAATAGWHLLVVLAAAHHPAMLATGPHDRHVPVVASTTVVVALVAVTLAVAAATTRGRGGSGLLPAAGTAVALPGVLTLWEPVRRATWPPYPDATGDTLAAEAWRAAHLRWAAVALLAVIALAWSLRDPYRTRVATARRRYGPRRRGGPAPVTVDRTTEETTCTP